VCKRYGLQVGAFFAHAVRLTMVLTAPISWPIGKLLDYILGEETALFRRAEFRALVSLHGEVGGGGEGGETRLTEDEVQIMQGAMDLTQKTAWQAMTPLEAVFAVSADAIVDETLVRSILSTGHSRIPVHEGSDKRRLTSVLLVKELVLVDLDAGLRVKDCKLRPMDHIVADMPLYSVLELFRLKRQHMVGLTEAIKATDTTVGERSAPTTITTEKTTAGGDAASPLTRPLLATAEKGQSSGQSGIESAMHRPYHFPDQVANGQTVIGLITIEDVIEELLQHELVDETDIYVSLNVYMFYFIGYVFSIVFGSKQKPCIRCVNLDCFELYFVVHVDVGIKFSMFLAYLLSN
jgi:metal transporter CNNM